MGSVAQKPVQVAYEKNPEKVTEWLQQRYPAIVERARKEKATILWLDQTGLRSDATVTATWAAGRADPGGAQRSERFAVNAIAAISNKGELYFTVFEGGFNVAVMIGFLDRLVRHLDRKIHLIVDGRPSHGKGPGPVLAEREARIEMHFLPGRGPDSTPSNSSTPTSNTTSPQQQAPAGRPNWPTPAAPTCAAARTSPTASKPSSARKKSATSRLTRHI